MLNNSLVFVGGICKMSFQISLHFVVSGCRSRGTEAVRCNYDEGDPEELTCEKRRSFNIVI